MAEKSRTGTEVDPIRSAVRSGRDHVEGHRLGRRELSLRRGRQRFDRSNGGHARLVCRQSAVRPNQPLQCGHLGTIDRRASDLRGNPRGSRLLEGCGIDAHQLRNLLQQEQRARFVGHPGTPALATNI